MLHRPDPATYKCAAACESGQYADPRDPCGCIDESKLYGLFPSWADLEDIKKSLGLPSKEADTTNWQVCPYEEHTRACLGPWKIWDELSCMCHHIPTCRMMCMEGEVFDPREVCACINED